jgi:hypothetical protein
VYGQHAFSDNALHAVCPENNVGVDPVAFAFFVALANLDSVVGEIYPDDGCAEVEGDGRGGGFAAFV